MPKVGVRPHYHRGTPALAGHPDPIVPISAGGTGKSCREFPGARPACRGTPETPVDSSGCSVRANRSACMWMHLGVRFGNNRVVCAEGSCSVRARTKVCARKDGYSPDEAV